MRLQGSCSAGENLQVRPRLDLAEGAFNPAARRAPAQPRGSGKEEGTPEALDVFPRRAGIGSRPDCCREGPGSAATCFPTRRGGAFPLPLPRSLPALPGSAPASGCRLRSGLAAPAEAPSRPHPRLQGAPGFGLLGPQSRSPREPGRRVGGAWAGKRRRDRLVLGHVPALGTRRCGSRLRLSWPGRVSGPPGPRASYGSALSGSSHCQS